MAALSSSDVLLSFQNTGKEHARTYEFLSELEDALGRRIVWLEYRPPKTRGGAPAEMRFEIVSFETADRTGAPFEMLMEAINAFRHRIGKGPIAPWWRSRICTTYMKTRLARRYVEALGWKEHDEFVGLRADEPDRVERLRVGVPKRIGRFAPLSDAGFTVDDVASFWAQQSFQLNLPSHLGNCTGCFLKDQADLSRALDQNNDAVFWSNMQKKWPGFGGKNHAGYENLVGEAPARYSIERALKAGQEPENLYDLNERRFKLVVIQERKRLEKKTRTFSCSCEGSDALALMDDEEENTYIAELPSEDEDEVIA